MYLLNPIWASTTLWEDPDVDNSMSFSDEVMVVAHRLCVMPFNESLYQFARKPAIHHTIYYQDLVSKFSVSSVASTPFDRGGKAYRACSVAMGEGFDVEAASNQLKFMAKGNIIYAVTEWHQHDMIATYVNELVQAGLVTFVSLEELKSLANK
jgi:hypothetical protein